MASPPLPVGKNRLEKLLLCLSWAHPTLRVPEELSCDHGPRATRASIKTRQSNTNVFPCGATHDVPGGHLVVSCPCLLATKMMNLWSLKDRQCLGYVYAGYEGTSMGTGPRVGVRSHFPTEGQTWRWREDKLKETEQIEGKGREG